MRVAAALLLTGCGASLASATSPIVAPKARYAVSFSSALVDERGVVPFDQLLVVGPLAYEARICPPERADLSDTINHQVEAAGGQAVIRLLFAAHREDECFVLRVDGLIVKRVKP